MLDKEPRFRSKVPLPDVAIDRPRRGPGRLDCRGIVANLIVTALWPKVLDWELRLEQDLLHDLEHGGTAYHDCGATPQSLPGREVN